MRIRSFTASNMDVESSKPARIRFGKGGAQADNMFSILIGENGTRKSQSLRDILDLSYTSISRIRRLGRIVEGKVGTLVYWGGNERQRPVSPKKIIAVSGVATDRFPSRLTSRVRRPDRNDLYRYVGPRTENNLISRTQSLQEIVRVLITNFALVGSRLDNLKTAFELLPLSKGCLFTFKKFDEERKKPWTRQALSSYLKAHESASGARFRDAPLQLQEECLRIMNAKGPLELRLDLDDSDPVGFTDDIPLEALALALDCGWLAISEPYLLTHSSKQFRLSDFSSGQWQVFSSLLFTALAIDDDTLVLIDEPENSLHPHWQREYLNLFERAISSCRGVHTIVATHSPLVASSLPPDRAEVIRLSRTRFGNIAATPVASGPYGWTVEDILEQVFGLTSTRSLRFTAQMDRALKLFAEGNRDNPELRRSLDTLGRQMNILPEDDVARTVIETMRAVVNASVSRGGGRS